MQMSPNQDLEDELFMRKALIEAEIALEGKEIPIGAVIVSGNRVIGKGHNLTEKLNDSTAHAEMIAITAACEYLGSKYLHDCTLYVTLEPCNMCAGAIHWAQLSRVVYGANDPKKGFTQFMDKNNKHLLHKKTALHNGVLAEECGGIVQSFFREIRENRS